MVSRRQVPTLSQTLQPTNDYLNTQNSPNKISKDFNARIFLQQWRQKLFSTSGSREETETDSRLPSKQTKMPHLHLAPQLKRACTFPQTLMASGRLTRKPSPLSTP